MIIKAIRGKAFGGLEHYLTHSRVHRVVSSHSLSEPSAAATEMSLVAAQRPDVTSPVLHIIIAAAPEDWVRMTDEMWLELEQDLAAEFGWQGHQYLSVEHPNPDHKINGPHRHVAVNKVHPESFELPQKASAIGARWDSAFAYRAWRVGDNFAVKYGLRRVADPTKTEASEQMPLWQAKRELATGVAPLIARAPEIRAALRQPDWTKRLQALRAVGVRLKPVFHAQHPKIIGIQLVDTHDASNRLKGSAFGREYSYPVLDRHRTPGTPNLAAALEKLDSQSQAATQSAPFTVRELFREELDAAIAAWRRQIAETRKNRTRLRLQHASEKRQLTAELKASREMILSNTTKSLQSEVRRAFQALHAQPQREALTKRHRAELGLLKKQKKPRWDEWLESRAAAGDLNAEKMLAEMTSRHGARAAKVQTEAPVRAHPLQECGADKPATATTDGRHETKEKQSKAVSLSKIPREPIVAKDQGQEHQLALTAEALQMMHNALKSKNQGR